MRFNSRFRIVRQSLPTFESSNKRWMHPENLRGMHGIVVTWAGTEHHCFPHPRSKLTTLTLQSDAAMKELQRKKEKVEERASVVAFPGSLLAQWRPWEWGYKCIIHIAMVALYRVHEVMHLIIGGENPQIGWNVPQVGNRRRKGRLMILVAGTLFHSLTWPSSTPPLSLLFPSLFRRLLSSGAGAPILCFLTDLRGGTASGQCAGRTPVRGSCSGTTNHRYQPCPQTPLSYVTTFVSCCGNETK